MASGEGDCRSAGVTRRRALGGIASTLILCGNPAFALDSAPSGAVALRFGLTPVFLSNDLEVLDELRAYLSKSTNQEVHLVAQRHRPSCLGQYRCSLNLRLPLHEVS
ncbi:hypothetical protein [Ferirhizobium litorale]|uniref:hypothetical protein n=1 Tax=Ferirhizobium litorale TaxID=2927786 RepID=UPI0028935770|nr:hypothetical protein [Fererhizobium litorale]